ncbi:MAG: hypothetical protein FWH20_03510 [Oscillospiraceae bacterium]|nr:hypothetical protein [Oscillospiraceae bacterium]
MDIQVKASFKKELLGFFRTKIAVILIAVFIGFAIFTPAMLKGMEIMFDLLDTAVSGMDMEESGLGDEADAAMAELGAQLEAVSTMFSFTDASTGVTSTVGDISMTLLIVFLLVIIPVAGGEQKKRSIIIPRSAGLSNTAYILPKFIIYPITAMVLCIAATLVSAGLSVILTVNNDLVFSQVLLAGILAGINLAMYTSFHISLGTATGKAGMSAAICIVASMFIPALFALLGTGIDSELLLYNPFSLNSMSVRALYEVPDTAEMLFSVIFAFALMAIVYFVSLFAQNAKRVDNSGNEILI